MSKGVPEPELHLPWVRLEGEPREGPPRLNRQNLFLLACREAFRNGRLTDQEKGFLSKFAGALGMPQEAARGFARLAKQEADEGKIQGEEDLDPKVVFKKACALAHAKGRLTAEEREILGSFSDALGVPMMRVDATLRQLAVKLEASAREVKSEIKLAADRNVDGSAIESSQTWGDGDPLSQSGIMRLGVQLPMRPGEARPVGAPPSRGPPRAAPPPGWMTEARKQAARGLGWAAGVVALGGWVFHRAWFLAEEPSLAMLAMAALILLLGLGMAGRAIVGLVRGA